ncbi:unnamed protein product, partial [Rotaria sordida]
RYEQVLPDENHSIRQHLMSPKENLETFSLIWLDASVNDTQENIDAQRQLRKLINFLKTFEDADKCEQYIRSLPKDDRIVFIVSGRFGVIVLLDELISRIRSDQARRNRNKVDEPLPMTFNNTNNNKHEQSTSDLSSQFIHSQLLIDCLVRMKSSSNKKNEFISLCRQYYKGNTSELSLLNEFEKFYSLEQALWWYTREEFLYRLINKALCVLNIDLLFLCRFFIRDIQQQLEQQQCLSFLYLYRCQLMTKEEIQLLQNSIGVKPFANITSFSYFPEEEEILFMLGSIFRLISVDRDEDELWIIRIVLVGDEH